MATYKLIIKNTLKTSNSVFFYNYIDDGIDNTIKLIFEMLLTKEINSKNKYTFFKESLGNFLIKNNKEDDFIRYFCQIQKTYHTLNKFAYNYKYRKAKTVVNTDMCLNELDPTNKNVMCIFHNNSKYLFHIGDLIKIINTALTHSHMFFSDPKCIKNPYDNIPFKKSTLYSIYFFIKLKTNYYPEIFFKFFIADFNMTIFKNNNECLLRDYSIKNYVYMSPANILVKEIKNMIEYHNDCCPCENIEIDDDFPKEKLIKIMRPYLLLYITSQYSYLIQTKRDASYILRKKFIRFFKFNPAFGRKKYKILTKYDTTFKRQLCGKIIEFDDKHIKFNNIENYNSGFLSDHLKYSENNFVTHRFTFTRRFTLIDNRDMSDEGSGEDDPEEDDPEEDDPEEDGEHRENDAAINNDEEFYEGASEIDSVN
jgi:hypothetical protein